ncbi:MAG: phosphoribosyl-ATP diphosphatase [Gammaproteobacteria bacterium]|nr:phosphoribosyl-ATP diphosphatase [Gammaproteobacteria bacterium]
MSNTGLEYLLELQSTIEGRRASSPEHSYTAQLFAAGPSRIAQKVGEEGVEVAIAAVQGDTPRLKAESADLLYHLIVLLRSQDITLQEVVVELAQRRGQVSAQGTGT